LCAGSAARDPGSVGAAERSARGHYYYVRPRRKIAAAAAKKKYSQAKHQTGAAHPSAHATTPWYCSHKSHVFHCARKRRIRTVG
jgi:hypothetical protein